MSVRFASAPVPFAAKNIALDPARPITPEQLAWLLAANEDKRTIAVHCSDRAELLRVTRLFGAALRGALAAPEATTEAPAGVAPAGVAPAQAA
jgi:hypothetical protein